MSKKPLLPQYDPNAFSAFRASAQRLLRHDEVAQPVPQINEIVRRGSVFGRCDSKPRTDRFPGDASPRVYVVALDNSWASWWRLSDLKVVYGKVTESA